MNLPPNAGTQCKMKLLEPKKSLILIIKIKTIIITISENMKGLKNHNPYNHDHPHIGCERAYIDTENMKTLDPS